MTGWLGSGLAYRHRIGVTDEGARGERRAAVDDRRADKPTPRDVP